MSKLQVKIEKQQLRAQKIKDARAMLDKAEMEKRDLETQEARKYDALNHEIDELNREIDTLHAEVEAERNSGDIGDKLPGNCGPGNEVPLSGDGQEIRFLKHDERMADHVKGQLPDNMKPSTATTGRMIKGMLSGWEGLEKERRALVGSEDPQGGYMLPGPLSTRFIDLARARMALSQAGAITVPVEADSLKIPKLTADPQAYWRGELDDITESDPTFGAVMLQPKTVAILTLVSHEVWEDAAGLGQAVEDAMSRALAVEIDRVGMFGGGDGNANEPTGIYYTDGITTVEMDTNGAIPDDYDKFLDCIQKIEEANGNPGVAIYSPRTKRKLAGLVTGITSDKTKLEPPQDFKDLRKLVTTAVPDDLTWGSATDECSAALMGGFNNVFMGMRNQVRIDVSPHGTGVFNKLGLWVRAFARVDFAVIRPAQLARLTGIKDQ